VTRKREIGTRKENLNENVGELELKQAKTG
jgi:hypothetical protein